MHKALVGLVAVVIGLLPAVAAAQVDELENPGSVSAIQERAFRMQHELGLSLGVLPLDAYWKGLYVQGSYGFHFTDTFAAQGRFAYDQPVSTGLRQQLERDFAVLPTRFDEVQFFFGGDLMWKPLYGKVAFLNQAVVHGEAFVLLGVTGFKYTQSFRPAVNVGLGGRIFVSRTISFRLDFTDNVVIPTGGASTSIANVMTITLTLALNFGATE